MIHSYRPIGNISIRPDAYAQRFHRKNHHSLEVSDTEEGPYFSEEERLSTFEIGEIDDWPTSLIELFDRKPKNQAEENFQNCMRGEATPKTLSEQIIVKLIYQALALGGLHCSLEEGYFAGPYPFKDNNPANDIEHLNTHRLRDILSEFQNEMSELVGGRVRILRDNVDNDEQIGTGGEMDDSTLETQQISEDITSDSEDHARSDAEGWFYKDDE